MNKGEQVAVVEKKNGKSVTKKIKSGRFQTIFDALSNENFFWTPNSP